MSHREQHSREEENTVHATPAIEDHEIKNGLENFLYEDLYPLRELILKVLDSSVPDLYYLEAKKNIDFAIALAEGERGKADVGEEVMSSVGTLVTNIHTFLAESHRLKMGGEEGIASENKITPASDDYFIVKESPTVH